MFDMLNKKILICISIGCFITLFFACGKKSSGGSVNPPSNDVDFWLTKGDQSVLLQKQSIVLSFGTTPNNNSVIDVNAGQSFQTIEGFGYTLTGGSAYVINQLN